jgi:excisionase family DNA binding protein
MTPLAQRPDVLTVEEAGEVLRIGRGAAYEAVRRGTLPAVRIGRSLRVPRQALETMLGLTDDEAPAGNGRQVTTSAVVGDGHGES